MSGSYLGLEVWREAVTLALAAYRSTRSFPKEETYGLSSQMRRAAVSVPSNIAEGKGRFSPKELLQFLFRARGSLLELNTQVLIAHELGYLANGDFGRLNDLSEHVGKLLNGLISSFQARTPA